ncbi:MAG: anaerobic ribonucleoside-triphosphate reductase activating protein [Desulfobacteraceae bacterium]
MKIGGLEKNSMIDFPGKISCVVFTSGCNFSCPYCHNPEIAGNDMGKAPAKIEEPTLFSFLEKRKNLLEGVVITGGEPTLQRDLVGFCRKIKELGYLVKLDTNGSRPKVLAELYRKKLVDFTAMDIKSSLDNYFLAAGSRFDPERITASIALIMETGLDYEFRTTCVKPFVDKKIMGKIGSMIRNASHYILQHCSKHEHVLQPGFFQEKNRFLTESEMTALAKEAEKYVEKCSIR